MEQKLKEKGKNEKSLKRILLKGYENNITFKVESKKDIYTYYFSLDDGATFSYFNSVNAVKMLDRNYTGALLGLFSTSNGIESKDYADFEWIRYKDYLR